MKRILFFLVLFNLAVSLRAYEVQIGNKENSYLEVTVNDIERKDNRLLTNLTFDVSHVKLKGNREVKVTPVYVSGEHEIELEPFTIAGRNRWYWNKRNKKNKGLLLKGWGKIDPEAYDLESSIQWQPWLNNATLIIKTEDLGCAACNKEDDYFAIAETDIVSRSYKTPEFIYVSPEVETVKTREISSRAYVDFPVNKTEIYPDYRRNPQELFKIRSTIDSVRNDPDITVTSLYICGTASPEGAYETNVRLSKGRTEALKNYVQSLYHFRPGFIVTRYEPVDWKGLAEYLESVIKNENRFGSHNLPHASQILSIVESAIDPALKNKKISSTYPADYSWLLKNVYPDLRHSDYKIEFEIKKYTTLEEILVIMESQPQKLSLSELFMVAESQPEGSDLYNRAIELAVIMYPQDPIANVNAAIAAMNRKDWISAERYLSKAGVSPEADYARAVFSWLQNDFATARLILSNLAENNYEVVSQEARDILQNMNETDRANDIVWRKLE